MGARIVTTTSNSQFVESAELRYGFTFQKGFQQLRTTASQLKVEGGTFKKPVVGVGDACVDIAEAQQPVEGLGIRGAEKTIGPYLLMVQKSGEKTS